MKDLYRKGIQEFEELNQGKMAKADFPSVFGHTFIKVFSSKTICAAFRVTGIHPFNPDALRPSQFKPSEASSVKGCFPLPQPSPVRRIMAACHSQIPAPAMPSTIDNAVPSHLSVSPIIDPSLYTPTKRVLLITESLSCSETASFLISKTPIISADTLLSAALHSVPDLPEPNWDVLNKAKEWSMLKKTDCRLHT